MSSFSLDDIRAAAEAKYGSTEIDLGDEKVNLLNPLRLPKTKRDALADLQKRLNEDGADQEALLAETVEIVAESKAKAKKLLSALQGDLAMLVEVFSKYTEGQKVGEASPSHE